MWGKYSRIFTILLLGFFWVAISGCEKKNQELIIYSGHGLKNVMEDIIQDFENKHSLSVKVIYAGSETLLKTITQSRSGDIYIPGSDKFIQKAGDLVLNYHYVSLHVPVIAIHKGNPKSIISFEDLLEPGVKIAIGNKNMCAMGTVTEEIFQAFPKRDELQKNITTTASTVNELLDLVLHKEVDAVFIWADMMLWRKANDLEFIEIPPGINKTKTIQIAVLSTTTDKQNAMVFADFVATEGRKFFAKHGFGEK